MRHQANLGWMCAVCKLKAFAVGPNHRVRGVRHGAIHGLYNSKHGVHNSLFGVGGPLAPRE